MVNVRAQIDQVADGIQDDVLGWRRHIHQFPELSGREVNTAAMVAEHLRSLNFDEVRTGVGGHGVVGVLRGGLPGDRVVGLRADMDALPIEELQDLPYASKVVDQDYPGGPFPVSHMCGHDVHTSALMGAASVLAAVRDELPGTVKFIFQPAEEGPVLGENVGAAAMVAEGALDSPTPDMMFVLHTGPMPDGTVFYGSGTALASSDYISITVHGAGVHGSTPWMGRDPMPVAAEIITALGQIYRQVPATDAVTVTIGTVRDSGRFNVIGDSVELIGTMRTLDNAVTDDLKERIARIASHIAQAHGLTATTRFEQHVPAVINEPAWLERTLPTVRRVMGDDYVTQLPPAMGYDDASEFVNRVGGVYMMFGGQDAELTPTGLAAREGGRGVYFNHSPLFYFNDAAIVYGVRLHAHVAYDFLDGKI
jgi:amidohydrolase